MTPDMSAAQMLNTFIFVTKGSRVLDRFRTNWSRYLWVDEKYFRHFVYTVAELKHYFAGPGCNQFQNWMKHPKRINAATISEAVEMADRFARGDFKPDIDIDAMIRNADPALWWAMRSRGSN